MYKKRKEIFSRDQQQGKKPTKLIKEEGFCFLNEDVLNGEPAEEVDPNSCLIIIPENLNKEDI